MTFREKLARRARKAGLSLSPDSSASLESYFELLRKWNQKVSLTSLPVEEMGDEALDRLLIEPVLAAKYLPRPDVALIDIGSGGGSPAIPMKIACPRIALRMVESKTRKAAFLREAVRHLDLADTGVESARFESLLVRPELHEAADVITLRAVRVEPKILLNLQALLRPGGVLFLFRTGTTAGESSLAAPPFSWQASHPLIPSLDSHLAVLVKT